MSRTCLNCGAKISDSGFFVNRLLGEKKTNRINKALDKDLAETCEKCGPQLLSESGVKLRAEIDQLRNTLEECLSNDFPLFTVGAPPVGVKYYILGLVTANVTVGTGFFNEWMQGFQDTFGLVSIESGMAHKTNKGELVARRILIGKALQMGSNAILGVDIDYGITGNNSAVINMQGTAAYIEDIDSVYPPGYLKAKIDPEALRSRIAILEELL